MISDEQQDQAALYVLDSLDANETAQFEAAVRNDGALRALVADLRDGAAALALTAPHHSPPPELKKRVLRDIALEKTGSSLTGSTGSMAWIPWAIAALFMVFCGALVYERVQLRRELNDAQTRDPLSQMTFATLAPQKDAPPEAKAVVAWQPAEQTGMIRVTGLPAVPGKDYQLWAVDADHKDPISAGMLHVDANGVAIVRFKPVADARHVKAFAISLEREGGMPKPEGPIVLVGTTTG